MERERGERSLCAWANDTESSGVELRQPQDEDLVGRCAFLLRHVLSEGTQQLLVDRDPVRQRVVGHVHGRAALLNDVGRHVDLHLQAP